MRETDLNERLQKGWGLLTTDPDRALAIANDMIAMEPDPRAFRLAAAALRASNRHEEAAESELQGIRFGFAEPLKIARSAQQARQSSKAKAIADDYLRTNPDDLIAMTIAAEAAISLNLIDEAETLLRQVVDRAPSFPTATMLFANALAAQLRLKEAADVLAKLLEQAPQEINAKRYLADLSVQMNDTESATSLYQEIISVAPNHAGDQFKYAHLLRGAGLKDESLAALRKAIAFSRDNGNAWRTLAHYFPDALNEHDEEQIRNALGIKGRPPRELGFLQLAISIVEHRHGNHQASFDAITAAQPLLSWGLPYDPDSLSRHVDQLIAAYTPDTFERRSEDGSKTDSPIFIVGMPRSGSTLLERILGQHSKIEAIGELPVIPRLVAIAQPDGDAAYKSLLPNQLAGEKLANTAQWYLERSQQFRRTEKPHFTDKYNGNWIRAGLIRLMFPNAKILDIRRDPLDCCWGVFKTVLVGDYAHDQRKLARHYADYVRFMAAMKIASPGAVHTVQYEELVNDIEGQVRLILDYLGLEFETQCVDFHLSTAAVTTASSEQVRRPVNREGIGSAEQYKQWLQPLIDELDAALKPL